MPITKHHKKKYPNSEWVRRRNIRRAAGKQVSKPDSSVMPVATEHLKENTEHVRSARPNRNVKSWFHGIKNVFAGRVRNSKDVASDR
jgi:hypothetical protein